METWRVIPGTGGKYSASDAGRLHANFTPRTNRGQLRSRDGVMALSRTGNGYLAASLRIDGRTRMKSVHRLVCLTFIGDPPDGSVVNHKNAIRHDNRLENLEYVTQAQNIAHAFSMGLGRVGSGHGMSRLNERDVASIRDRWALGTKRLVLARDYGVSVECINTIVYRKKNCWRHVS